MRKELTRALFMLVAAAAFVSAQTETESPDDERMLAESTTLGAASDPGYLIQQWISPNIITGYLTFFFLLFVAYIGFGLLGAVQVPPY